MGGASTSKPQQAQAGCETAQCFCSKNFVRALGGLFFTVPRSVLHTLKLEALPNIPYTYRAFLEDGKAIVTQIHDDDIEQLCCSYGVVFPANALGSTASSDHIFQVLHFQPSDVQLPAEESAAERGDSCAEQMDIEEGNSRTVSDVEESSDLNDQPSPQQSGWLRWLCERLPGGWKGPKQGSCSDSPQSGSEQSEGEEASDGGSVSLSASIVEKVTDLPDNDIRFETPAAAIISRRVRASLGTSAHLQDSQKLMKGMLGLPDGAHLSVTGKSPAPDRAARIRQLLHEVTIAEEGEGSNDDENSPVRNQTTPTWIENLDQFGEQLESGTSDSEVMPTQLTRKKKRGEASARPRGWDCYDLGASEDDREESPAEPKTAWQHGSPDMVPKGRRCGPSPKAGKASKVSKAGSDARAKEPKQRSLRSAQRSSSRRVLHHDDEDGL